MNMLETWMMEILVEMILKERILRMQRERQRLEVRIMMDIIRMRMIVPKESMWMSSPLVLLEII